MPVRLVTFDRSLQRAVGVLDQYRVGSGLRVVLGVLVVTVPAAQSFKIIEDVRWMIVFLVSVLLLIPLQHYHKGAPVTRLTRRLAEVNGTFAGSIEVLGQELTSSKGRQLEEKQCKLLCIALLHRIRDYTALGLQVSEAPRLRATLSVPIATHPDGPIDALKVWCYDQTHPDAAYTCVPLYSSTGATSAGAPRAYLSGAMQIIFDIDEIPGKNSSKPRPYRSVVSVPLSVTGPDGKPLAVVNIDADEPGFFDARTVMTDVLPLVSPAVTAIGLALSLRKKGSAYVFPK